MKNFQKRISETIYDTYPLQRMLPQFTVFNIFEKRYLSENNKQIFFDNHKFLKLREGYFGLFACRLLDKIEHREHLMYFSKEQEGDIAFISKRNEDKFDYIQFDVKEYHPKDRHTFKEFLDKISIKDKISSNKYGLIIGIHRDVNIDDVVVDSIKEILGKITRGIFIVSEGTSSNHNPYKSKVQYYHSSFSYEEEIEIGNDGNNRILIYQDELNF